MKPLLTVLAMASIFAATPAVADYDSCMKYCIPEHGFDHCNPICAGGEKKAEGEKKTDKESAGNFGPCETVDEMHDSILVYTLERHGPGFLFMSDPDNSNEIIIDMYFGDDGETNCKGTIMFTDNCDLIPDYQCESRDKAQ